MFIRKIQNTYSVYLKCHTAFISDTSNREFTPDFLNGPAFECLKNPEVFKTANIEFGAVTWLNGEVDCAPEFMYNHSCPYKA